MQTNPLLTGVYNQVATVPAFSGKGVQVFDSEFFKHIEKRRILGSSEKSLPQIIANLTSVLEELHDLLRKSNGKLDMGTTEWREMATLTLNDHGQVYNNRISGSGKKFLGKSMNK